ncbi:hypothetical protein ETAA8_13530 [Anatilimnocola aggregata]|uniref:Uncharacterized protein n=1 Tax=Anatilimnocola aggregata TaxID=2528021 RepID=A0A517Y7R2_9BACT|nr:hypothetical protein ETAA8_13530 [Anatilimnocola aggregata]
MKLNKTERMAIAVVILSLCVLLMAYNGSLTWMGLGVFAAICGIPEAKQLARWAMDRGQDDRCNHRKD